MKKIRVGHDFIHMGIDCIVKSGLIERNGDVWLKVRVKKMIQSKSLFLP